MIHSGALLLAEASAVEEKADDDLVTGAATEAILTQSLVADAVDGTTLITEDVLSLVVIPAQDATTATDETVLAQSLVPVLAESGAATSETESLAQAFFDSDLGTGVDVDTVLAVTVTDQDTSTALDAHALAAASFTDNDSGSGLDARSLSAAVTSDDLASSADGQSLDVASTVDDGTGTEDTATLVQSDSDTYTALDDQSLIVTLSDSEQATGLDDHSLAASFTDSDTGSGLDVSTSRTLTDSDSATALTESFSSTATLTDSDSLIATEPFPNLASGDGNDVASATNESQSITATAPSSDDSGSGLDTLTPPLRLVALADAPTLITESASVAVIVSSSDLASSLDTLLTLSAALTPPADSASATDAVLSRSLATDDSGSGADTLTPAVRSAAPADATTLITETAVAASSFSSSDTLTWSDTAAPRLALTETDANLPTGESTSVDEAKSDSDSGAAADAHTFLRLTGAVSDLATATFPTPRLTFTLPGDQATTSDAATPRLAQSSTDSGSGAEVPTDTLTSTSVDSGSAVVESASITAILSSADTGVSSDTPDRLDTGHPPPAPHTTPLATTGLRLAPLDPAATRALVTASSLPANGVITLIRTRPTPT